MSSASVRRIDKLIDHVRGGAGGEGTVSPLRRCDTAAPAESLRVGVKSPDDVVIVSTVRTAIAKAKRGGFRETTPDSLLVPVMKAALERTGGRVKPGDIGDVCVGNVGQHGAGALSARMAQLEAGIPYKVPLSVVNRQCSSGLQAVANIAEAIRAGYIDCGMAAGVESMTLSPMTATPPPQIDYDAVMSIPEAAAALTPMGITSENVAERYGVSRADQDAFAAESQARAARAQDNGWFDKEIVPVTAKFTDDDGKEVEAVVAKDEGIRRGTTAEKLGRLKPSFKPDGSSTAGNSSQTSDGAAACILMTRAKAESLGLPIRAVVRAFNVSGVAPDEMGIGPVEAIPRALAMAGISVKDVDAVELNEAFASQALYCMRKLGLPAEKVNPNGGAIALGHPLGATGARQVATLIHHLERTGGKIGVVSMCIGTGMGAACVFERE